MVRAALILTTVVWALDALARRGGVYVEVDARWPAAWRPVSVEARGNEGPYRAGERVRWERAVAPGIPRAVSLGAVAAMGLALAWSLAVVLALGDGLQALRGVRPGGAALASLLFCATRASAQWMLVDGALIQHRGRFAAWAAVALGADLALATVPVPCSDKRSDDIAVALAGIAIDSLLALGFALSVWRRRGTVARDLDAMSRMN